MSHLVSKVLPSDWTGLVGGAAAGDSGAQSGAFVYPDDVVAGAARAAAVDRRNKGLGNLKRGHALLQGMVLPHGCSEVLKSIGDTILRLEKHFNEALEWEERCPQCGPLVEVQLCSAAGDEEPPEWSMGRLFVSQGGLLFESMEQPAWCMGPFQWSDIRSFNSASLSKADDLVVSLQDGSIQRLSGVNSTEHLEKCSGLKVAMLGPEDSVVGAGFMSPQNRGTLTRMFSLVDVEASEDWIEDFASPRETLSHTESSFALAESLPSKEMLSCRSLAPKTPLPLKKSSTFKPSRTFMAAADQLPEAELPKATPVFEMKLDGITLDQVCTLLEEDGVDWPLERHLTCNLNAYDVTSTPWTNSQRISGTKVRRLRFKMPLPDDVPSAVKRLVKVPDATSATLLARLGRGDRKLVLVTECCTHEAPFGENFCIQETLVFTSQSTEQSTSIKMVKFCNVRWIKALPWGCGMVGNIIETKAQSGAKEAGSKLAQLLVSSSPPKGT
eukprot:TRINITY_DN14134_c0_g1_i1.p1 TRINITY_DN14134_c0_g1~~TRINITY_DN14134_c0_g1_i1.p1  ORF type:complete len:510 (+),score=56.66 TRINITY_DN14134_c0_g1_i1:39-1532(+)